MNRVTADQPTASPNVLWGSDYIADLLRDLGFEHIALTPGASFRGLHDSLVNHLGNERPRILLCVHEEHAVALAHGYTKVTGTPMAVALHSNVGLMHATMAIFNAWCDRVPIVMIGAMGPIDAVDRRPWVDWIHTSADLGALVRGYTKWDDRPGSVTAALEALVRADRIATTEPMGPVYVCLDAALQETRLDRPPSVPPLARFPAARAAEPADADVAEIAALLGAGRKVVIMMGRVSRDPAAWPDRVALAERLGACVLTDIKTGAVFPTRHPLHPHGPGLFLTAQAREEIRAADVILGLDWVDLGGSLRQACGGDWPAARVISCSLDQYVHNGWSMDYQALPAADISILASPDALIRKLVERLPAREGKPATEAPTPPAPAAAGGEIPEGFVSIEALARIVTKALAAETPSYMRLPIGWPGEFCDFRHPLDYLGYDGGGGIGSGPGMAVGSALALRGTDRLPVAIIGDGDYLMGVTALWTAVNCQIPMLVIVANNQSFFNDELHQERMALLRHRPVENKWIGMRMADPAMDMAQLARGQGAIGLGPTDGEASLAAAVAEGIAHVKAGHVCVIDARVAPEYARATSSALMQQVASTSTAGGAS